MGSLEELITVTDKVADELFEVNESLARIASVLERAFPPDEAPPMPGPFTIRVTQEFTNYI